MAVISDLRPLPRRYYMPASTRYPHPNLLNDVRQVLRLHHYSIHMERSPVEWIARFVRFDSGGRAKPPARLNPNSKCPN
jgi:hypothetical protein